MGMEIKKENMPMPAETLKKLEDPALMWDTKELPCASIKNYAPKQIAALQKALFAWLEKMPYYSQKKQGKSRKDFFKELFPRNDKIDLFTFNCIKSFSICYGISFKDGKITEDHKKAFENIHKRDFKGSDAIYQLKTSRGNFLYEAVMRLGVDKGLEALTENKNTHKIYKDGEASEGVRVIQMSLNKWLSRMRKDNILEATGTFNNDTAVALKMFNRRFNVKAYANEITAEHLAIFKDILQEKLDPLKYSLKTRGGNPEIEKQKHVYDLLRRYNYKDAEAILKKEETRRSLASRGGFLFGFINSFRGPVNPRNIEPVLGINKELGESVFVVMHHLAKYSYSIYISSAGIDRRRNKKSRHSSGNGIDFVISKNGGPISKREAHNISRLLEEIEGLGNLRARGNNSQFKFLDEYNYPSPESTGDHFHIQKQW